MSRVRRLTIACVAADLNPGRLGGAELHVVETIKRLAKHHRVYLFVGNHARIKNIFPTNVSVIPVYYPKVPNLHGLLYILFGFPQIVWYLFNRPIDLIWAKQSYPQAPLAALIKYMFGRPLYVTAQNPMLHTEELVISGPFLSSVKLFLAKRLTPLIAWSLRQADTVAAVSSYSSSLARDMGAASVIVVPNGINPTPSRPLAKKPKTFTIITCSSLIPRNGIDILINAVYMLPKSIRYRLIIAGSGPESDQLKRQVNRLKINSKVKFLGSVPNHQINRLLTKSHVFVRPSRWEGFGVAFLEAMDARIPVIATPVGGIVDFVTHRRTGLLALPNDARSVSKCLQLIRTDSALRRRLITQAARMVKTRYSWDHIARQIETEFHRLCP